MTIRPARPGDVPAIKALLDENKLTLDGVDYSDFSHPCLVAVREGEIVGMIQAALNRPYSIITDLVILRSLHHRGIGAKLVTAMELILRSYGVTAYVAFCATANPQMAEMMERFGLEPTGIGQGFLRRLT